MKYMYIKKADFFSNTYPGLSFLCFSFFLVFLMQIARASDINTPGVPIAIGHWSQDMRITNKIEKLKC